MCHCGSPKTCSTKPGWRGTRWDLWDHRCRIQHAPSNARDEKAEKALDAALVAEFEKVVNNQEQIKTAIASIDRESWLTKFFRKCARWD